MINLVPLEEWLRRSRRICLEAHSARSGSAIHWLIIGQLGKRGM